MAGAQFLGILWEQIDHEAEEGKPGVTYWITDFSAEPEAQEVLLALQTLIKAGGTQIKLD